MIENRSTLPPTGVSIDPIEREASVKVRIVFLWLKTLLAALRHSSFAEDRARYYREAELTRSPMR